MKIIEILQGIGKLLKSPEAQNARYFQWGPLKRFAVIRFSGMAGEDSLKEHTDELSAFIKNRKLEPLSQATYAFFNPPWTLPFMRRNEVMVEVVK